MANFNVTDGAPLPFPPAPAAAIGLPDSKRTVVPVASLPPRPPPPPPPPPPARVTPAVSGVRAGFDVASVPAVRLAPAAELAAVAATGGCFLSGTVVLSLLMMLTSAAEAAVAGRTSEGGRN